MFEKVVGGCVVLVCLLFGMFLALASFFALNDDRDDFYLYGLLAIGVGLVVGGCGLMLRLAQPKPTKRPKDEDDSDAGW